MAGSVAVAARGVTRGAARCLGRIVHMFEAMIAAQRGHFFHWAPVFFAIGIGGWFSLRYEPDRADYMTLVMISAALLPFAWRGPETLRPLVTGVILACLGALAAGYRAHSVAAPVLEFRFYGAIQGRVVHVDRSLSDKTRLTLDQVVLEGGRPDHMPQRVRVSLHGRAEEGDTVETGATVILTGHLSPPQGPAEPGGFDFRRMAWFQQIGGVGYTRTPVLVLEPAQTGWAGLIIARLRRSISQGVKAQVGGEPGAFAAAVLTGDRSGIGRQTIDDLRNSSLAHLLAISGLHMALLTGFVFMIVRGGLILIPTVGLRFPVKKIAAVVALAAASFYLLLSGGATPTKRAFVMAAVMLVAILLDRRALSLRAVAVAAMIILATQPETLIGPGFQMSFAATSALIVAFRTFERPPGAPRRLPKWLAGVTTLFFSSLVAGAATAPFAAFHFNRVADYSILANMLSIPVMGMVVMPAAVIAAVLWPLGIHSLALWVMELGTRWILWVAETVSRLPGAVSYMPAAPPLFLPIFTLGALFLLLWRGPIRLLGIIPMAVALMLWGGTKRPDILIADTGGLVGVISETGRALSKPSGNGFIARSWLENDGDAVLQDAAFERGGFSGERGALIAQLGGAEIVVISGRGWRERVSVECREGRVLVVAQKVEGVPGPCRLLDAEAVSKTGSLAGWLSQDGQLEFETATELSGQRLWTTESVLR